LSAPFLAFLSLSGAVASSAGWIMPKNYYEEVRPDGFKQQPIGAGPYKFVRQVAGSEVEFEATPDYWRKVPSVNIPGSRTRRGWGACFPVAARSRRLPWR